MNTKQSTTDKMENIHKNYSQKYEELLTDFDYPQYLHYKEDKNDMNDESDLEENYGYNVPQYKDGVEEDEDDFYHDDNDDLDDDEGEHEGRG